MHPDHIIEIKNYAEKVVVVASISGEFEATPDAMRIFMANGTPPKGDCTPTQFICKKDVSIHVDCFSHTSNKGMMKEENHYDPGKFTLKKGDLLKNLPHELPVNFPVKEFFDIIPIH